MLKHWTEKQAKYYDEVIRLHYEEGYGEDRIAKILPIGHTTANRWIANFAAENGQTPRQVMKQIKQIKQTKQPAKPDELEALKAKVAELEKQLRYEKMKAEAYDTMIDIAEKKFSIPIRKKAGAKR